MPLLSSFHDLRCLQYECDAGASLDLLPGQTALHELLSRVPLSLGLVRRWIENHPDVAPLRNLADAWAPPPTQEEVLTLMHRRNEAARQLGYTTYPDAILAADDLTREALRQRLHALLNTHLFSAAAAAAAGGVRTMQDWYPWLMRKGKLSQEYDPQVLLHSFARQMGLQDVLRRTRIIISREGACFAACVAPDDLRLHTAPVDTLYGWRTLFHEFGHLCTYALLPEGAQPWLSAAVDEMLAVLTEHAAVHLLAEGEFKSHLIVDMQHDYTRTAVSALYELDLWEHPHQAETLYAEHYGRLVSKPDASLWHRDSFRSIDCMTIHGYALGQLLAESVPPEQWIHRLHDAWSHASELTVPMLEKLIGP